MLKLKIIKVIILDPSVFLQVKIENLSLLMKKGEKVKHFWKIPE